MDYQVSLNSRRQMSMLPSKGLEGLLCGNYDMATNILSRLPTLMLLRLKLVSKGLNDLITDRDFARLQTIRKEIVCGFFYQERYLDNDDYLSSISYVVPGGKEDNHVYKTVLEFIPDRVTIHAACNGLICCRSRFLSLETAVYVCNPLRKEWNKLQLPDPNGVCSLALAFDPFKDPVHVMTHFKVVAVRKVGDTFLFDIYSSEIGRWRKSKEMCQCNHNLFKNKSIFAAGDLYWLTDGDEILMLNCENELTFLVKGPLPPTEFTMRRQFCIGESEGILNYVLLSEHGLQLWMLEDCFTSQWELKNSISLEELQGHIPGILYNLAENLNSILLWLDLFAFKDGILFIRVSASMYTFDFETRKAEMLCDLSTLEATVLFPPIVVPYSLSLVPLDEEELSSSR